MKYTKAMWGILAVAVAAIVIFFGKSLYQKGEQVPPSISQDSSDADISGEPAEAVKPSVKKNTPPEPVPPVDMAVKETNAQAFVLTRIVTA